MWAGLARKYRAAAGGRRPVPTCRGQWHRRRLLPAGTALSAGVGDTARSSGCFRELSGRCGRGAGPSHSRRGGEGGGGIGRAGTPGSIDRSTICFSSIDRCTTCFSSIDGCTIDYLFVGCSKKTDGWIRLPSLFEISGAVWGRPCLCLSVCAPFALTGTFIFTRGSGRDAARSIRFQYPVSAPDHILTLVLSYPSPHYFCTVPFLVFGHQTKKQLTTTAACVGDMLYTGTGCLRDYGAAVRYYLRAAHAGDPGSANAVGLLHELGRGVTTNLRAASCWYQRAAELG